MSTFKIAIDGPSGAGKSTVAKGVALKLDMLYVDTGAIYRAVGLFACRKNIPTEQASQIIPMLNGIKIDLSHDNGEQHVILNGEDVSQLIRQNNISMYASAVSAVPEVRDFLLSLQRGLAEKYNVVMDGRDIGTVIMPDAQLKVFMTASAVARAERRYNELRQKGSSITFAEIMCDMIKRDENDRNRKIAPAIPADDAVMIDNSNMTIEENIDRIVGLALERMDK